MTWYKRFNCLFAGVILINTKISTAFNLSNKGNNNVRNKDVLDFFDESFVLADIEGEHAY
jgi:hypothetical protein